MQFVLGEWVAGGENGKKADEPSDFVSRVVVLTWLPP
jgi:hypothetical protein